MAGTCLCIDVGGTFIKYAKVDSERNLSGYGKVETPYKGIEVYVETLADIYRKFEGEVEGISLSVPGMIDSKNGVCMTAGALEYANGLALVEELGKKCPVPIAVMNDAKSAALAEATWGALADCEDSIVITLGTGVGGALIKGGEVHMGKHFAAGEFSTVALTDAVDSKDDLWCGHNGVGRLLTLAARIKGKDVSEVSGEDVFQWINEGDEMVTMALDQYTKTIARMLINLQCIFDPDRFAFGGGISRQPKLMEFIQKNLDYYYAVFPSPIPKPEITTCKYFNEANLLGAYGNFLKTFQK